MIAAAETPLRLLMICEGSSDVPVLRRLASLVIAMGLRASTEQPPKIEWVPSPDGSPEEFWRRKNIRNTPLRKAPLPKFRPKPFPLQRVSDTECARHAVNLLNERPCADGYVIVIDGDELSSQRDQSWREQLRRIPRSTPVAFAVATQTSEAWLLSGLEPDAAQLKIIAEYRRRNGLHPLERAHELSHKENVPKSSKDLLKALVGDDNEVRVRACLADDCLDRLCRRGAGSGVTVFLGRLHELLKNLTGIGSIAPPCDM